MRKLLLFSLALILISASAAAASPLVTVRADSATSCSVFPDNLRTGSEGEGVLALQKFLNSHGFTVAPAGAGSPGNETDYFGARTKDALARFQAAFGISPARGYFGPLTRAKAALLCAKNARSYDGAGKASIGTGNEISSSSTSTAAASLATSTPASASLSPATINPGSIVGILCYADYAGGSYPIKGSGVIVNPAGYILTARHLVDPAFTATAYADTLTPEQSNFYAHAVLDHCDIGLPENAALPSPADIRSTNPSVLITHHFQYRASLEFVPTSDGLSPEEYKDADFAVLRIAKTAPDCGIWNKNCTNGPFPYTPVLGDSLPAAGSDQLLSYGYPAELINQSGDAFYDFYLKGAVGAVGNYFRGNSSFYNLAETFSFESADIQDGRSGSPVFWNGRVMGILYGSTSSQESFNVTMTAIHAILSAKGLDWMLYRF